MITIDVTDRAGLIIRTRVKIKISLYSEYISRFLGMIENILISVDLVAYRVNIFVTRLAPQSLILEIPYLYSTRVQLLFNDDSMQMLLQSADGRREVRLADWLKSNPRNYSGLEVFHKQDTEEDDDDIKNQEKDILDSGNYLQKFKIIFMFY